MEEHERLLSKFQSFEDQLKDDRRLHSQQIHRIDTERVEAVSSTYETTLSLFLMSL